MLFNYNNGFSRKCSNEPTTDFTYCLFASPFGSSRPFKRTSSPSVPLPFKGRRTRGEGRRKKTNHVPHRGRGTKGTNYKVCWSRFFNTLICKTKNNYTYDEKLLRLFGFDHLPKIRLALRSKVLILSIWSYFHK
jgi:hypothetical protein